MRIINNQIPPNVVEMIPGVLNSINKSDEFFDTIANMMKKLYDALLEAGFTKKQAIRIVAGFAANSGK